MLFDSLLLDLLGFPYHSDLLLGYSPSNRWLFIQEKVIPENPQPVGHKVNKSIPPVLSRVVEPPLGHAYPSLKVVISGDNQHKKDVKNIKKVSHLQKHHRKQRRVLCQENRGQSVKDSDKSETQNEVEVNLENENRKQKGSLHNEDSVQKTPVDQHQIFENVRVVHFGVDENHVIDEGPAEREEKDQQKRVDSHQL